MASCFFWLVLRVYPAGDIGVCGRYPTRPPPVPRHSLCRAQTGRQGTWTLILVKYSSSNRQDL